MADHDILAAGRRAISVETAGLAALDAALAGDLGAAFMAAVTAIRATRGRVIVSGMGKSGHVGRKIAATLASTGTPAYFVHPGEASHGDLGMLTRDDVVLALSWSGETAELRDIITFSRRFALPLIAVTSAPTSPLGRAADICLCLPKVEEACPNGLAPTSSTTAQLVLGDALAVALLESRGFTAQDFRTFHPGGSLGAALVTVADLMHTGDAMPLARTGTPMAEVVAEMTKKRLGCCVVTDAAGTLAGIVTDGDLRRHFNVDLARYKVDDVMSRNPRTIRPDQLAGEALERVNAARITALIVAEGERPVGVIHLHDLLRRGVA